MGEFDYSEKQKEVLEKFCLLAEDLKEEFDVLVITREKGGLIGQTGNAGGMKDCFHLMDVIRERIMRHYE